MNDSAPLTRLEIWDYLSLSTLVALSTMVGLYHVYTARKSKVTKDFLVTSKDLGMCPLILSSVATFFSAIGMIGFPLELYMNGVSIVFIMLPTYIAAPVGSHLILPIFFKLNRNTIYEYLELRFCKTIRICTSLMVTFQMLIYTSVVMYAPALALSQVTGLHLWASVVSIGVACIIYTSMGGIKAVVWADATQLVLMMGVIILIIVKSTMDIGGLDVAWERMVAGNRTDLFIWSSSPHSQYTIWSLIVAGPFHILSTYTLNQATMQRCLSNSTLRKSQMTYYGGVLGITFGDIVYLLEGMLLYAYFYECDPLLGGLITVRDQMIPLFSVRVLSFCTALPGVFVAGIMCATLSTLSSLLNSLTAVTLSDYVKPIKPDLSDETTMKLSRLLVVVYGAACIGLVALAENLGRVMQASFGISGLVGGPILTIFIMGMLLPWVNSTGAICGLLCSVIFPMWSWLGNLISPLPTPHAPLNTFGCSNYTSVSDPAPVVVAERSLLEQFYAIPSFWYPLWSLLTGLAVSLIVTKHISSQDPAQVDPELIFPFVKTYVLKRKSAMKKELDQAVGINNASIQPLLLSSEAQM